MAEITDYVDITITLADQSVAIPNFGALLVVGHSPSGDAGLHTIPATPAGLTSYVQDLSGAVTDAAYKLLAGAISQTPHTADLLWYNSKIEPSISLEITPQAPFTEGRLFAITVNGTVCSTVAGPSADATSIATALHTQADLIAGATSTDNTGSFTLVEEDDTYTDVFLGSYDPARLAVSDDSTTAAVITQALDEAIAEGADFYGVLIDTQDATNGAAAHSWAEINGKQLISKSRDVADFEGTGQISAAEAAGYHYATVFFSEDDSARPDARIHGRQLSLNPGSSDYQFKNLSGVVFSPESVANSPIKDDNGMTYTRTKGVSATDSGVAASGRPMAVTRNVDWLEARLQQELFGTLVNNEIVTLDSAGIAKVDKGFRAVMIEAERMTVIQSGWVVNTPSAADITAADKNIGLMKGFTASAQTVVGTRKIEIGITLS